MVKTFLGLLPKEAPETDPWRLFQITYYIECQIHICEAMGLEVDIIVSEILRMSGATNINDIRSFTG